MLTIHQHHIEKLFTEENLCPKTLGELFLSAVRILESEKISSPKLNAEIIICSEFNINRTKLYLRPDAKVTEEQVLSVYKKIHRRISGEPVQYITGYTEFYGLKILVNRSVLIPRPETELLVDKALEIIGKINHIPEILEIGTGSGCVAIALAKHSHCKIHAIDISIDALKTAALNSRLNGTEDNISFELTDLFTINDISRFDLIISNPPYISSEEMKSLQAEVKAEPDIALTDFADGLNFYRKIFQLISNSKAKHDVIIEIGDGKKTLVESLAKVYNFIPAFSKDYMGTERIIHIRT